MFLKALTLKGFKSFAEPTTLEFEPGVTVVVGPNGSGKSNVVDAIAWVLGAQAPSAVRSQKMDDVIFAGTAKRTALGRAEVSLTIDNSRQMLPIEFNEVTLTRTLFRTGESEYAINGVPCRLLDLQELLSDSGVGRQQHVIVSQGQIDAVLNARPEDRRAIIEEAAGVLKFRKRKERSQRRLDATEENLVRLTDLAREVRRQLRPLERQAEAARRHESVKTELDALRLHLAGRELVSLRTRLTAGAADRAAQITRESELKGLLARLDADIVATEAELAAQGVSDISDSLRRCESLRERARGLAAVLAERTRSTQRDRQALLGADVVAALESEAAELREQLTGVEQSALVLGPAADELNEAENALAEQRAGIEADETVATDEPVSNAAAETRGELAARRAALAESERELSRVAQRVEQLSERRDHTANEAARLREQCASLQAEEPPLVAAADEARSAREAAEGADAVATTLVRELDGELRGATARAEALAMALDEARARAGAERLAGVDGVLGTLLDVVVIDTGWAASFEAAVGDALAAVVFSSATDARHALSVLTDQAVTGAVLALPVERHLVAAPTAGEAVRHHVRGRTGAVDALLDRLLDRAVRVDGGWRAALDVSLAHPELVVVTESGDRFASSGWRIGTDSTGATAAALEDATGRVVDLTEQVAAQRVRRDQAAATLAAARRRESDAASQLEACDRRFAAASNNLARVQAEHQSVMSDVESLLAQQEQAAARRGGEQARVGELESLLPDLEAAESAQAARAALARSARAKLSDRASAVAALRRDLEVRAAGLQERREMLQRRLAGVEERLRVDVEERQQAEQRRVRLDQTLVALDQLRALVAGRLEQVDAHWQQLDAERQRQSEAARAVTERLDGLRRQRHDSERELEVVRERARKGELEEAELRLRLESLTEALRRDLDAEPAVAEAAPCPELPEGATAAGRARELERELKLMGPINPLALEEFTALSERSKFLDEQISDVQDTRRELNKVIRAVDAEIQSVFSAAYSDVAANFTSLFGGLFPGGTGQLVLTNPDDLLNTGIEVEAKPSGKNVKKLSLLSGGERSLTALAFLFAVFRSRPSPFYVMDEVEAALDDVNLHRFLGLVQEFRNEAQLLIVSHQKRTMEAADCLFGVTMQPGGSSKVISEKIAAS